MVFLALLYEAKIMGALYFRHFLGYLLDFIFYFYLFGYTEHKA